MLSRSGSDASSSLQRSKSAASVKERRKHPLTAGPIDPNVAKVHALIAAHRAFDGSQERASTTLAQSENPVIQRGSLHPYNHSGHNSPASHLQRQRSTLQTRVPKLAHSLQVPAEIGTRSSRSDPLDYLTEFGNHSENYGALPSSYRRLRTSRSSLTPLRQPHRSELNALGTPFSQARTLRSAASSNTLHSPGFRLRLKHSINRLRPEREHTDRNITAPAHLQSSSSHHKDAIELARSQYSQGLNQLSASYIPSFSLSDRARKAQKAFRRSFRAVDGQEDADVKHRYSEGNEDSTHQEKRSLSATLASKVKKALRGSRSCASIPPQQLHATRTHFGSEPRETSTEAGFDSYLDSNQGPDGQETLQTPSDSCSRTFDDVNNQITQRLSKSNSAGSLIPTNKSRTTSWGDSTTTGSTAIHPSVCDPKRLSIIKEDGGPHQPSSSAGRHIGGVTIFQQPLNIPEGQVIDSQRIYSALMKRIEEEQEEMDRTQAALKEIHDAQAQDEIIGHYLFSAPTIRKVESTSAFSQASIRVKAQILSDETLPLKQNEPIAILTKANDNADRQHALPFHFERHSKSDSSSDVNGSMMVRPLQDISSKKKCGGDSEVSHTSRTAFGADVGGGVINPSYYEKNFTPNKFGYSTDSLYSKTTNGGTNTHYVSPTGSMENFAQNSINIASKTKAVDMLRESGHGVNLTRPSSRHGPGIERSSSDLGTWGEWMEHQVASLHTKGVKRTHFRERTQIEPGDTSTGRGFASTATRDTMAANSMIRDSRTSPEPEISINSFSRSEMLSKKRDRLAESSQLRELPWNSRLYPDRKHSSVETQDTLQDQTNLCGRANTTSNTTRLVEKRKPSGFRKISPGNITSMLRTHLSHINVRHAGPISGKENRPVDLETPEPVSTPGRHQVLYLNSACAKGPQRYQEKFLSQTDRFEESPSDRRKRSLSSRLSRPFDMDVPQRNRPFDSTFLGKREIEMSNRLSVAPNTHMPCRPKSYGNIGLSLLPNSADSERDSSTTTETTALPIVSSIDQVHSTPGQNVSQGKRFMINKYLQGRRQNSSDTRSSTSESFAFV